MDPDALPSPPRGNVLRQVDQGGLRLLKIYRRRRGRAREALAALSHYLFEGKRGISPTARHETERLGLTIWRREGFAVPRVLDAPPPTDLRDPSLWLEYLEGRSLWELTVDPAVPVERKTSLARRLGREHSVRHRRALALDEPLLLHEHATVKHVLVVGERLVTIDLEGAYSPRFSVLLGVGNELAGFIRSLWCEATPCFDSPLTQAYVAGYADPSLMLEAVDRYSQGVFAWFRRTSDRWRRGRRSKSGVMEALAHYLRSEDHPDTTPSAAHLSTSNTDSS